MTDATETNAMPPRKTTRNKTAPKSKRRTRHAASSLPELHVEDLPETLRSRINDALAAWPEDASHDAEVYEKLDLTDHGVNLTAFLRYTRTMRWRLRLGYIGGLVRHFTGAEPTDAQPGWAQAASMMLTAALIEALDRGPGELSLSELVQLARVLHECRMAGSASAKENEEDTSDVPQTTPSNADPLPEAFVDTVRTIYGVTLDHDAAKKTVPPPSPS